MKKLLVVTIAIVIGYFAYTQIAPKSAQQIKREKPIPNVVVAQVALMPIRDEVEALGTGKAFESITITSKISEVITSINFADGEFVEKGQLLVQLQDSEQQAKVRAAYVRLNEHKRELERISSLVTSRTIAANERDRLQSLIDGSHALLDQEVAALSDYKVNAAFSGRLGLRQVSRGGLVSPGQEITTLDDVSKIKLDFSVPERFIQDLQVGKTIEATTVAYPDIIYNGVVSSIDSRVNPATRAVTVRAIVPNDNNQLIPGMLMKVKLIKQSRESLLLPESAIIPIQNRHYVYLLDKENKVQRVQVKIGLRTRGWVEIADGLSIGDSVIIRGILKVRPGDVVMPEQAERFNFAVNIQAETVA
ncbi:efflux RND transporter periplasmic adaptor subunit [Shewanella maritima]|uniref:efflux RND transporter periplasmic adaptor subunit n=1 Tax=Shewanella maritima TaxID=2520507 RepID=UPI003734C409